MEKPLSGDKGSLGRSFTENLLIALGYWAVSHINFILFKSVGVLPMPVWPAAALAFLAAFYRGMAGAPGIALGTVLANHLSLGGPLNYALCIAVMNTLGPVWGAALMRSRVSRNIRISGSGDIWICVLAGLVLTPMLTALGGIGFKWALGLIPKEAVLSAWGKWALAHCLGTLFFAVPVFAWIRERKSL